MAIFLIFLFGLLIRVLSALPANTIIGFDQARDLFAATTILRDHHIAIIGPTAGNNPSLHHGSLFWYYLVPGLVLFKGNPIGAVIFNNIINALSILVLYLFGKSLFNSKKAGVISAIIVAVSYYYIQFSGWLSNPTVCLFTAPVFFYGVWKYHQGKTWGLPLAFLFLGLSIEFELFFIYLIPTFILAWLILRPKLPTLRIAVFSILTFCLSTFTMILTEIKFHFAGIKAILGADQLVGGSHKSFFPLFTSFIENRWEAFYLNIWPQNKGFGLVLGTIIIGFIIYEVFKKSEFRKRNLYLLLMFFSPAIMLIIGIHNAPWFLIGRPMSVSLMSSYLISKIKPKFIVTSIVIFIIVANLLATSDSFGKGQILLEPDEASLMSDQLKVIDYTYTSSNKENFEINTLTNPLYVNAVWGYQYYWYGPSKYKYLPSWAGGDQLYPYNTLPKANGNEKYLYLIMDTTERIPPQYKKEITNWAGKKSKLLEEKQFGGIEVQKRILTK